MTRQTIYVHHKQCFSMQGGECDCIPTETKLATPTADTGMAREIAEEISRAATCTHEGCATIDILRSNIVRLGTEIIASRLSTREQEVAQLIEAASRLIAFVSDDNGKIADALTKPGKIYVERLRAALDKVRSKT